MEAAAAHQARLELHDGYVPERDDMDRIRGREPQSGNRDDQFSVSAHQHARAA